jgi:curved DNA-binding protein CbpA
MATSPDYYEVLQVSPNADEEVIQAAYRRLAMKWHPDRNPGDPFADSQIKLLNDAYAMLSDPMKRREYDLGRRRSSTSGGREEAPAQAGSKSEQEPRSAAPPSRGESPSATTVGPESLVDDHVWWQSGLVRAVVFGGGVGVVLVALPGLTCFVVGLLLLYSMFRFLLREPEPR